MRSSGQAIGPYAVISLVNRGGSGRLYLARDTRLNRRVALKLVNMPQRAEYREQVLFEARALAYLNHRAVVQIYDVIEARDYLVLVMEYVPGTDLAALLGSVNPDTYTSLWLASAVCTSLSAAHRQGIVHRDLKPANILLDTQGHVKLGDFGIAHTAEPAVPVDSIPGSIYAMSPEHAAGAHLDQRSDLFSLGLLLYRLLCGRHPFADSGSRGELLQRVLREPHRDASELVQLPPGVGELLNQLLEKDPARRPQSALEVRHRLTEVMRNQPLPRGPALERLLADHARELDSVPTAVDLPEDLEGNLHSYLHPLRDQLWRLAQWAKPQRLALGLLSLLLVTSLAYWSLRGEAVRAVEVLSPVVLAADSAEVPAVEQLHEILLRWIASRADLYSHAPGETAAAHPDILALEVRCEPQLCSLMLVRRSETGDRSSYGVLLSGAPAQAWEASLGESLVRLFSDLPSEQGGGPGQ